MGLFTCSNTFDDFASLLIFDFNSCSSQLFSCYGVTLLYYYLKAFMAPNRRASK